MRKIKDFIKSRKKTSIVLVVFLIIFLVSLALTAYQSIPDKLRVVGTGTRSSASAGTDIRVDGIKINDVALQQYDIDFSFGWVTDENFYCIDADPSNWFEIEYKKYDTLELTFENQYSSGCAEIYINNKRVDEIDLFSAKTKFYTYNVDAGWTYTPVWPFLAFAAGLSTLFTFMLMLIEYCAKNDKKFKVVSLILLLFGSVVLHISTEIINSNIFGLGILAWFENILLYFTAMLIIYIICAKVELAVGIVSVIWLIFAVVNYYVTIFRGVPITIGDFHAIQTAANVAADYDYSIPSAFYFAFFFFGLSFAAIIYAKKISDVIKTKVRLSLLVPTTLIVLFVCFGGTYVKEMNLWQPRYNVTKYGLGVNMASSILNIKLDEPEEYYEEEAESILNRYAVAENDFKPNIIVVMNETFSDLSALNSSLDNNTYMKYYNSLSENTIKGTMVSSAIGGQTANVEYEFLTGNTLFYMPGAYPYQQLIYTPTLSLPRSLKERGYQTIAIHPFIGNGYKRPSVYENFSFDAFLDVDDFTDYELVRDRYVSDKDSYEKIIEEFEKIQNTSSPAFIFNVTMQNHSPYDNFFAATDEVVKIPGTEGKYPDAEDYLTLIKKSDEALSVLIEYFEKIDEPTVILFFGDHQPKLSDEFFEEFWADIQNQDLEYIQKRYEVPFLMWANYDIQEEENLYTSTNYLSSIFFEKCGISLTAYQNYLLQLRETFPAITLNGFLDTDGNWHTHEEAASNSKLMNEYWYLEYYHIRKDASK